MERTNVSNKLMKVITNKEFASVFTLIVLWLFFYSLNRSFLSLPNLTVLFTVIPVFGIVTIGITLLMIGGEFDLSVASVFALSPIIVVILTKYFGIPGYLSFFIALLVSLLIGFLNGIITTKIGIPSFIVTLGTLLVWLGVALQITLGEPLVFSLPFEQILVGSIGLGGLINAQLVWFIVIAIISYIILEKHRWGNWIFAVGGNKYAAKAKGINVDIVKISLFMLSSFLAGLAGIMYSSIYAQAIASQGENLELDAIAAAVIGGTSLLGGEGSVISAIVGTIIIWSIENGLILIGVSSYVYETLIGAIVIIVTSIHLYTKKVSRNLRLGEENESE
ncbi:MAG: ABC transporter permease [Sulfolobus sp.]|nr:ABC transporter permease [Sulfolobus sp.]